MIGGYIWCAYCVLILIIQFILSPITVDAATATPVGNVVSRPSDQNSSSSTLLRLSLSTNSDTAVPGEQVTYDLTVTNTSKATTATNIRVLEIFPAGFKIKSGSGQLNGKSCPDPVISADGQTYIFKIGNLAPEGLATIRFMAEVTTTAKPGKAVNFVSAISSAGGNSNVAKSTVLIRNESLRTKDNTSKTPQAASATSTITEKPADSSKETAINPKAKSSATTTTATDTDKTVSKTTAASDTAAISSKLPSPQTTPAASKSVDVPPASASSQSAAATDKAIASSKVSATLPPATPSKEANSSSTSPPSPMNQKAPAKEKLLSSAPLVTAFAVPDKQNLAKLIGMSEIPVMSDVDGQFVKSMADNQILDKEFAGLASEANLFDAIRAGRSFSRESRAASARTEQAKAQTGQALALLLPSVAVRVSSGSETSKPSAAVDSAGNSIASETHSRTDASLTVRQPLFDLPSFMDWRRRKMLEHAREENYRVSDGDAYISTANAYLALVSSKLQTDMTREFESQLNELLVYIEKRAGAGAASISDMARVRARSQSTLSSRLEQESAHAAAGVEFVRLTNLVPRKIRLPELEDLGASILPKSFDIAVSDAMKSNPEITALTAELLAADIDKYAAKSRYLPRLDAEYSDTFSLHAGGDPSSSGQRDQRIMAVFNWSLFNGGSDYKNNVERAARHKELQYRLDDQRRRVVQSLSANYATLITTRERIDSGYQELKSITTAAEAMSKRMLSGNQSLLDLLDVYDRFYQIRSKLVSLHILEMNTIAQLVRLTYGTPAVGSEIKTDASVSGMMKSTANH